MPMVLQEIVSKAHINKYRIQATLWIIGAVTILVCMVLLWMFSKTVKQQENKEAIQLDSANTVKNINITNKINDVNDLSYAVKPIEFETIVRDLRSYPDEFKDGKYLSRRKGKWTLEVMNVEAHEVIKDYLDSRDDRKNFAYFRYTDGNNHQKYVLIYETFATLQEALNLSKSVDFNLPRSVKVIPEEINRYVAMIDNYERAEEVHDMSGSRPRNIILRKTNHELAVKRVTPKTKPKPKPKSTKARTSVTTTQSLGATKPYTPSAQSKQNSSNKKVSTTPSVQPSNSPTPFVPNVSN